MLLHLRWSKNENTCKSSSSVFSHHLVYKLQSILPLPERKGVFDGTWGFSAGTKATIGGVFDGTWGLSAGTKATIRGIFDGTWGLSAGTKATIRGVFDGTWPNRQIEKLALTGKY